MATATKPQKKRFSALGWMMWGVYCFALLELACRGYWNRQYQVPWLSMHEIFANRYYPELVNSSARAAPTTLDDDVLDVLVLGGSVVSDGFGNIGPTLRDELHRTTGREVRLYNAAGAAKTSRDSVLKYRKLDKQRFDLVVFYHGINESRINQWPRDRFRNDYTHNSWYARVEALNRHPELNVTVLPYTLQYLAMSALDEPSLNIYMPRCPGPDRKDFHEGEDVKTGPCFAANLEEVLQLAQQRGATVLLPTFSIHMTEDKQDYADGDSCVQLWGSPTGVAAAVKAHNAETRRLAEKYEHVLFVDLDESMPRSGKLFTDCCHLTEAGCKQWVEQTVAGSQSWIAAKSVGSRTILQAAKPANIK